MVDGWISRFQIGAGLFLILCDPLTLLFLSLLLRTLKLEDGPGVRRFSLKCKDFEISRFAFRLLLEKKKEFILDLIIYNLIQHNKSK
jgi:hypothetical protein